MLFPKRLYTCAYWLTSRAWSIQFTGYNIWASSESQTDRNIYIAKEKLRRNIV